jgi:hypothetical protein
MLRLLKKWSTLATGDNLKVILNQTFGLIREDTQLVNGREAAMSVYSEPIPDQGMALAEDFPDVEKRKEFGEMVKKEFVTSNYPMYAKLYALQLVTLILRHTVIGRRPF